MKREVTGVIAVCQCRETVGALSLNHTDPDDITRLVDTWLKNGCTLYPQYGSTWATVITKCKCNNDEDCDCREDQHAKLLAFARDILEAWPDGGVDGGELQELAEKHRLLIPTERAEPCGEYCVCAARYGLVEFPLTCYRRADFLMTPNS